VSGPELLTLKEVRSVAADAAACLFVQSSLLARLCSTVEHWHREAAASLEANAACALAKEDIETQAQGLGLENARLSALVARQREALEALFSFPGVRDLLAPAGSLGSSVDRVTEALSDRDGQRAAAELRQLHEDAEKYRALRAESAAILERDEEFLAQLREAERAQEEQEEELRLLRAWEEARRSVAECEVRCRRPDADATAILLGMATADRAERATWEALAKFRARQKGAPA
jgi:hypothetical protein